MKLALNIGITRFFLIRLHASYYHLSKKKERMRVFILCLKNERSNEEYRRADYSKIFANQEPIIPCNSSST